MEDLIRLGTLDSLVIYGGATEQVLVDLLAEVEIKELSIGSTELGRRRMPWLNRQGLRKLWVYRTQFSNPALKDLPDSLERLDLTRTRINDDGLPELKRLRNLKRLSLRRTPTTELAIEKLRRDMPWCKIEWEPLEIP